MCTLTLSPEEVELLLDVLNWSDTDTRPLGYKTIGGLISAKRRRPLHVVQHISFQLWMKIKQENQRQGGNYLSMETPK